MATDGKKLQPIIIKRIKKNKHAPHGGAWKIAYADFVTAMMAFFLLMWLLGSTSDGDKKGLSDYFTAPLKVSLVGGSGSGASNSIIPGGGADLTMNSGLAPRGSGDDAFKKKMDTESLKAEIARQDAQKLAVLSAKISAMLSNSAKLSEYSSQIRLEITPDGLQIQIIDDQKRPMFASGSDSVKPYMHDILSELGKALSDVENRISLDGHTDRSPYSNAERGYSNWELSADRANATRRELVAAGMPENKVARVMGLSSTNLLDTSDPLSPTNRRISITVMTREAEERLLGSRRVAPTSISPTSASTEIKSAISQ
jgi:chemotaxis protein MotB